MKFFLDTANVDEIRPFLDMGLVDGITTNPTLIAASGRKFADVIREMCDLVSGPVSAEVSAMDHKTMLEEGRFLAKIASNVAVKVPLTPDGLRTCRALADQGIMVNVTLCFSPAQALLAAKAGAAFISPFVGRLDDIGHTGMQLVEEICLIYDNYPDLETEVLAASIRNPLHVIEAAQAGADVATIPPKVMHQLFNHPLTESGIATFIKDWEKTGQKIL